MRLSDFDKAPENELIAAAELDLSSSVHAADSTDANGEAKVQLDVSTFTPTMGRLRSQMGLLH